MDPEEQERHDELLAALLLLMEALAALVSGLMLSVARGELDPYTAGQQGVEAFSSFHAQAAALGRQLAGIDGEEVGEADDLLGSSASIAQAEFLANFTNDIQAGRYNDEETGEVSESAVNSRGFLYGAVLLGTANLAWANSVASGGSTSDGGANEPIGGGGSAEQEVLLFTWHDTGDERECSDCPGLAAGGPYTRETLPTTPGAGATKCGGRCRCYLTTSTGRQGFRIP